MLDHCHLIEQLRTNFIEILIKVQNFSLTKKSFENIVCEMKTILSGGGGGGRYELNHENALYAVYTQW